MKNTQENKKMAIQYLYGELPETELEAFEERLFADESTSVFVDDIENDLIDEYVRGELEFEQKQEFESKYLTSESRHERVAIARTLQDRLLKETTITSTEETTSLWQSIARFLRVPNFALAGGIAALLLLALLGGVWLISQPNENDNIAGGGNDTNQENLPPIQEDSPNNTLPEPSETPIDEPETNINKPNESNNNKAESNVEPTPNTTKPDSNKVENKPTPKPLEKKPKETPTPKQVVPKPKLFVASLLPPLRSSKNQVLKFPSSATSVRLQLFDNFGDNYKNFVVKLSDGNGNSVWQQEIKASKKGSQKSITINVPYNKFKSGNYEIAVTGVTIDGKTEEINFYNFVVQKGENKQE